MLQMLVYTLVSFVITLILTPAAKKVSAVFNIFAGENHRTIHSGRIPRMGGLAIGGAVTATVALAWRNSPATFVNYGPQIFVLLGGSIALFVLGSLDDKQDLAGYLKLVIELIIASFAVWSGWRIEALLLPGNLVLDLGWAWFPVSVLWIVGVLNALNIIDGVDGLAATIAAIVVLYTAGIALLMGNHLLVVLAIIVFGAMVGFLWFNRFPASIFMGDSGTLPLGFMLACISFNAAAVEPGQIYFFIPLLMLAVPITDTILAIVRRVSHGRNPFTPDKEHIHHRLLDAGLSHNGTVAVLGGITLVLCSIALLLAATL